MEKTKRIFKDKNGSGFPLIIAITLSLLIVFTGISEYFRLMIVAQGVRDALQAAVISTVNDNYDDVYHGVREGYSGAYQPIAEDFEESLDYGDIYITGWTVSSVFPTVAAIMKNALLTESWNLKYGIWMWIFEMLLSHQVTKSLPALKLTAPSCWRFRYPLEENCCRLCVSKSRPVPGIRRDFNFL